MQKGISLSIRSLGLYFFIVFLSTSNTFAQVKTVLKGSEAKKINPTFSSVIIAENNNYNFIQFEKNVSYDKVDFLKSILELTGGIDFELKNQHSIGNEGIRINRFNQRISGIPVMGADYVVRFKNGQAISANGNYFNVNSSVLNSTAGISEESALEIALAHIAAKSYMWESEANEKFIKSEQGDVNATFYPQAKLVYASESYLMSNPLKLVYQFDIHSSEPISKYRIEIDANTGSILNKYSLLHHQSVEGSGVTLYNGEQSINLTDNGGEYSLNDDVRGQGINTYDMQNGINYGSAIPFTENDTFFDDANNTNGVSAHFGAAATYDYFFENFGLNSFDGNGAAINSFVHFDFNYVNAFWDGQRMTYGDGDGSGITPLTTVDIVGHEIAHAVTQYSADLIYQYESGALNESFSDIFGQSIEFEAVPETASWNLGDEIFTNGVDMIRSMSNPNSQGQPDTYLGDLWFTGSDDNGGVHYNSGVQNFWFYLLVEGGSGTNDHGDSYEVSAIGLEKAQQIAFRNLYFYLNPNSQYIDARVGSEMAAVDLYGSGSPEVAAVKAAWNAVGVPSVDPEISVDSQIDFGYALLQDQELSIPIKNTGLAPLILEEFSINNSNFVLPSAGIEIASEDSYELILQYNPQQLGVDEAELIIVSNANDAVVNLSVEVVDEPIFSISPSVADFSVLSGNSIQQEYNIVNESDYELNFKLSTTYETNTSFNYASTGQMIKAGKSEVPAFQKINSLISTEDDEISGGYSWTDSDAGASYSWYDISAVGNSISLSDDSNSQLLDMGMEFPFFEETFNQVAVCSNGWVSFTNTSSIIWNEPLPSTNVPENVIALMAQDLLPNTGNCHYYFDETNQRFIIQYTDYSLYSNPDARFTMQLQLYTNGTIKLLYDKLDQTREATVGIQNGNLDKGLTVAYADVDFFKEGYAVEISNKTNVELVSFSDSNITVPGNGTAVFYADINTLDVNGGDYVAEIFARLDDFQNVVDTLLINLEVIGAPNLVFDDYDFGDVFVGQITARELYIKNLGTETLIIENISLQSESENFDFQLSNSQIAPRDSALLTLNFNPAELGDFSEVLIIQSNDSESSVLEFSLTATAISSPEVSYSVSSIDVEAFSGEEFTETISITNNSAYAVNLSLLSEIDESQNFTYNRVENETYKVGKLEAPLFERSANRTTSDDEITGGYNWIDTESGLNYNWYDIQSVGTSVSLSDDSNSGAIDLGFDFEFFGQLFSSINIGSNGWLSFTDNSGSIWTTPLPSTSAPENVIALLAADLYPGEDGTCHYYFDENQNRFIIQYTGYSYCCSSANLFTMQAQIYANGEIIILYDEINEQANGTVGIQNADKTQGVTINYNDPSQIYSGYGVKISKIVNWLSLSTDSMIIEAGNTADLDVNILTQGLFAGNYTGSVLVRETEFGVDFEPIPVNLNVEGASSFDIGFNDLDFRNVQVGNVKEVDFMVSNNGTDELTFELESSLPEIFSDETNYTVEAGKDVKVTLKFEPSDLGAIEGELTFTTNDPNNEKVSIPMMGKGVNPPSASISEEEILIVLDQDEVDTDEISISNSEESADLNYSVSIELEEENSSQRTVDVGFYSEKEVSSAEKSYDFSDFVSSTIQFNSLNVDVILDTLNNIPDESTGAVFVNGYLYIVSYFGNSLLQYDFQAEQVVNSYPIHDFAFGITFDGENFWIGGETGIVRGYDLQGNLVGDFDLPFNTFSALSFDGQHILAAVALTSDASEIYQLNVDGSIAGTLQFESPELIFQILYHNDYLWYLNPASGFFDIYQNEIQGDDLVMVNEISTQLGESYSLAHNGNDLIMLTWDEGYIIDDGISGWLSSNIKFGVVEAGMTENIQLTFNSTGLENGTYKAAIRIETNDPENPTITVNATLSIGNHPPEQGMDFDDHVMNMNDTITLDLDDYFLDDQTDVLTYEAHTDSVDIINMSINENILTVLPNEIGSANVTVSAFDGALYTHSTFNIKIEEVLANNRNLDIMTLYPNPSNGILNIKTNEELIFTVFDLNGRKLNPNLNKTSEGYRMDISKYNSGVYIIKAFANGKLKYGNTVIVVD
jgi:Zn-dependent metalloprotease